MKKIVDILFTKGFIFPISCAVMLIVKCVNESLTKYMWMDEILTYFPSSLSFFEMLSFVNDKINAGNYAYFITIWFWAKLFSATALSLRLFSSLCFCLSILLIWLALKKMYGLWSSSIAVLIVFLSSALIINQNSEARFYGMLFAELSALFFITVNNSNKKDVSKGTLISLFLLNGLLPLTHLFGFIYSALFLCSTIISDLKGGRFRSTYYIVSLSGWMLFIPFFPSFKRTLELSKPHFWIKQPLLNDLTSFYLSESVIYLFLLLAVFTIIILTSAQSKSASNSRSSYTVLLIAAFSLVLPLFAWIYSQFFQSLFLPRYMIIFELGLLIMAAASLSRIFKGYVLPKYAKIIVFVLLIVVSISSINAETSYVNPAIGTTDSFPPGIPIVSDRPHSYLPRNFYNPLHREYYFILDWEVAVDHRNSLNATQDFQVMRALKSHLPKQNILSTEDFLLKFSEFVVLPGRLWFDYRIRYNSNFSITPLNHGSYLVKRKNKLNPFDAN